ncbi:hypothetical protein FD723_10580 [Nostoc sp. C052]|uniref:hypothetical protein n=1 Tax=Nostoc sp. C052 TaxID=2576902 RepID=UPI0015C3D0A2|nr:hypothetical protein [Nostoc sp. C052]QLE40864.1 hypothetical protein FD723_10580 [Nostoc sp. C052]
MNSVRVADSAVVASLRSSEYGLKHSSLRERPLSTRGTRVRGRKEIQTFFLIKTLNLIWALGIE